MHVTELKHKLQSLFTQRNTYLSLCVGLLLALLMALFTIAELIRHQQIIVVPPAITSEFSLTRSAVSSSYLEQMSRYFISLRLNLTPETVTAQQEELLRHVSPEQYGPLKIALLAEIQAIQDKQLSSVFYPVTVKVNPHSLTVRITGDLVQFMGNEKLPTQRLTYQLLYDYAEAQLSIRSFEQVEPEAPHA